MKNAVTVFMCSACGRKEPKWLGRCPECGAWNTLKETKASETLREKAGEAFSLPLASVDPAQGARIDSGMAEVNRVLGGGIMRAGSVLVGGEPGIGKSTLLLQTAGRAHTSGRVLYVSGEESPGQIRLRADRIGVKKDGLELLCTGELRHIMSALDRLKPVLIVVDSIQTLHSEEAGAVPGTANQMKYCVHEIVDWCKERGSSVFLVAHVTKEGLIAGPKAAEHIVDTVLYFEQSDSDIRFLRATKNRFGDTDELGLFRMGESGLVEIADPSELFIVKREGAIPAGVAVAPVYEGSRVLLVEIQALTVPAKAGLSRVYSEKIDSGRVSRVAAVLEKHTGVRFSDQDIYVNVAGGMRLTEVGIELALAAALYSARSGIPIQGSTAIAGELSLAGEARPIPRLKQRLKTCRSMGYGKFIGPRRRPEEEGEAWTEVSSIKETIIGLFGKEPIRKSRESEQAAKQD